VPRAAQWWPSTAAAFGLTQRVPPPALEDALADPGGNPYSLDFSAALAVEFGERLRGETGHRPIPDRVGEWVCEGGSVRGGLWE